MSIKWKAYPVPKRKPYLFTFFRYYGAKWRAAKHYPKPLHNKIIEPFAGAAGYSMQYPTRKVVLYDLDPVIFGIWDYLIKTSKEEIRRLPTEVKDTRNLTICQEAKWLIGFWLNPASASPGYVPAKWMRGGSNPTASWGEVIRDRIADQVDRIRHWKVFNKSYEAVKNIKATWFVDPPYQVECGRLYKKNEVDFHHLARWCRDRKGQVIVCERQGAEWLPFRPFKTIQDHSRPFIQDHSDGYCQEW